MLLSRRPFDAERARRLRRFGVDHARFRDADGEIDAACDVTEIGVSSTLNNINATLALVSLADVDARLARSRHNVERSEERRVGKECVSTCRFRWAPDHYKHKIIIYLAMLLLINTK